MSDGSTGRTPNGQAPPSDAEVTRPQPAVRAANPSYHPPQRTNPAPRSANPGQRPPGPVNGGAQRPVPGANGPQGRPGAPANPTQVPIWDAHPTPEPKPSFRDRVGGALGLKKDDGSTKNRGDGGARSMSTAPGAGGAVAVAAPTPAPARPQAPVPAVDPGSQPSGRRATPAPGAAPLPDYVPAPGQDADLAERGPITQPLPAVPGAAPAPKASAETPAAGRTKVGSARRTRKARLRLSRLDPWSVMKTSFLFSIAAGIMLVVAVYAIWTVLNTSGLFDSVDEIVKSVVSTPGDTTPFRIEEYVNTQKVMGVAALVACVDVLLVTALATLGSFLYNLAATMLGGLEVTLAED